MLAVITGGTKGIGLSVAIALGKAGYHIILTGRSQESGDSAIRCFQNRASQLNLSLQIPWLRKISTRPLIKFQKNTIPLIFLLTMLADWAADSGLKKWRLPL